ncbi:O-antigen ligase family protein [Bacillus sp. FJAT-49736]|uniref:O-antigen ligase family protein n=1 Tax=Bacillus sp. FJAT-49736 TaxID=2833582 RepID=UPI001BC9160B|nr:O-antigen ligase family protein [Bacillus sp. FJAT-49736]MBS4172940.1 O-antigen ligase family protein [Bacillus sp. FJAT-49736]
MVFVKLHSLEANSYNHRNNLLFKAALIIMAILLHQSQVILGINISFSDIFCFVLFLLLLINKEARIPVAPTIFFLVVSITVLSSAVFFIPAIVMYNPSAMSLANDYMKLVAIFIYFIVGYNLTEKRYVLKTIKWYSRSGIMIGGLGTIFTLFHIHYLSSLLFFDNTRYRGLMIDPNYFSVLQISAFVYFSRVEMKMRYKLAAFFVLLFSVLISGSKTGIMTLIGYFTFRLCEYILLKRKGMLVIIGQLLVLGCLLILIPVVVASLDYIFQYLSNVVPSFSRIQLLFTDFSGAFSENGSGRTVTWEVALHLIQLSPLIGIGIGTYSSIANELFYENHISHNTFLQLSSEWGLPLAFLFFMYILIILWKATTARVNNSTNTILRDIIIILLLGSLAISLNNARILWLVLGALVSSLKQNDSVKNAGEKDVQEILPLYQKEKEYHA